MKHLKEDKAVYEAIQKELNRQRNKPVTFSLSR